MHRSSTTCAFFVVAHPRVYLIACFACLFHSETHILYIQWVNKQRMEKKFMEEGQKKSSMSEEKVQALESIGFAWAKRKGEASWMIKYNELKRFVAEHGHCDVATKYQPNPALGRWVSTQRSEYKALQRSGRSRHMTQAKINMLNGLKFKWEMLPQRSSGSSNSSSNNSNNDGSSSGGED